MTMKYFSLIVLLSTFALNLSAQNSDSSKTNVGNATIIHATEINAAAKTDSVVAVEDAVLRVISIGGKYNVGVSVVTRSKINGKTPPDAIVHDLVTEVYHIIKGRGILLVGGTLDSPVKIPSDDPIVRKITGPSSTSKSIIGGKPYEVGPGDIVVIPPNTPHGFIELKTKTITYTLIRIDTERVLELKN
jgi:mannose-6-phosphate isomerase-like protein (cupin superfamily)